MSLGDSECEQASGREGLHRRRQEGRYSLQEPCRITSLTPPGVQDGAEVGGGEGAQGGAGGGVLLRANPLL